MKILVFVIWILVCVQCQEESGRQAIALLSMWPMLRESLIAFINQMDFNGWTHIGPVVPEHDTRSEEDLLTIMVDPYHLLPFKTVKQSAFSPYRMTPKRVRSSGEAVRIARHDGTRSKGWLWCSENSTFALKPCPGDPALEECLAHTNVSRAEVGKLMEGIWKLNPHKSIKKWALCYLSKNGVMSSSGVLRQGVVLKSIPHYDKPIVEKTINKCLYKTAHDPAETAWHYLTCFRTKLPKYAKIANRL